MDLKVEINSTHEMAKVADGHRKSVIGCAMITPPIDESYWLARVPVSSTQAVVCFPKFGTIGIGFQKETDWNTNLPYTTTAEKIFAHIKHNKGRGRITDERCIEAIRMLQRTIEEQGWLKKPS